MEAREVLIYKMDVDRLKPMDERPSNSPIGDRPGLRFVTAARPSDLPQFMSLWVKQFGIKTGIINALKILAGRRMFFGLATDHGFVTHGWANHGFCRHYAVEKNSIVLGPISSEPEVRGRGLGAMATRKALEHLANRNFRQVYIDTTSENIAAQRMIEKTGFEPLKP